MKRAALVVGAVVVLIVCYRLFLASPAVTNPEPRGDNIICFGDSLTHGIGAGPGESYPDHLQRMIGRPLINAGVPGDTTADALLRLQRDVLEQSPRVVLITLGGNDMKNGVPADEAFANLEQVVTRIQDRGALVVVGGIDIPLFGSEFAGGYEDLCEETGCVLIPNVFDDIMGRRGLMADRIHPNGRGYQVMASHFERAVRPYL